MRKALLAASMLSLAACGYVSPDAGQEAVLTRHPWLWGDGGVVDKPVHTGSVVVANSTSADYINVTPQAFEVKFDNLMPSDRIPVDFHTVIRLQVTDSVELVKNWQGAAKDKDDNPSNLWFWGSIEPIYVNLVREEVKKHDMTDLVIGPGVGQIEQQVTDRLNTYIRQNKMPVKLLTITMGKANIPGSILAQTTQTATQQQRKQTMIATAEAEKARIEAEKQRALADNAYRVDVGRSPEQELEYQRIKMLGEACKSNTCIFGSGAQLLINR